MNQRIKKLAAIFGVQSLGDWQKILPSSIESKPGVGRKSLDVLRKYLAENGLTLRGDRDPSYWLRMLSDAGMRTVACPFVVLIDSAEQHPFEFSGFQSGAATNHRVIDVPTKVKSLGPSHGDYSIEGFEGQIHIERKSMNDAHGTILGWGEHRERFERELEFLDSIEFGAIVIECSLGELLSRAPARGRKTEIENRLILNQQYLAWLLKYRAVKWIFCDTRGLAQIETFRLFEKFYAYKLRSQKHAEQKTKARAAELLGV
jgi:hypothetical protein